MLTYRNSVFTINCVTCCVGLGKADAECYQHSDRDKKKRSLATRRQSAHYSIVQLPTIPAWVLPLQTDGRKMVSHDVYWTEHRAILVQYFGEFKVLAMERSAGIGIPPQIEVEKPTPTPTRNQEDTEVLIAQYVDEEGVEPEMLTKKGVADMLDKSTRTVEQWVKSGKLPKGVHRDGCLKWPAFVVEALLVPERH